MEYNNLTDTELKQKLDQLFFCERFKESEEYKLLNEAAERIVTRAINTFALATKADDIGAIIELQVIIRKYRFELWNELERIAIEGKNAFIEAQEQGQMCTHD